MVKFVFIVISAKDLIKERCEMSRLSGREQAVWDKRNAGLTFKQIAKDLGLCPATVSFAYRKAYRKIEYEKERLEPTELEVYKRAFNKTIENNLIVKGIEFTARNIVDEANFYIILARKELEDERK